MSKAELKEALSDINRMISEITRDRIQAIVQQDYGEADRLLELQLQYMQDREAYRKQLSNIRRSKF